MRTKKTGMSVMKTVQPVEWIPTTCRSDYYIDSVAPMSIVNEIQ